LSKPALRARPLGDSALTIIFDTERSRDLLHKLHAAAAAIAAASVPGVYDVVPGYLSIAIYYDALRMSYEETAKTMLAVCESQSGSQTITATIREHEIPVVYDGPDLADVARATGLTIEEVISRHAKRTYTVDLIGFVPGFAYLSELDPSLRLDRRPQPRPRVPAGSVAIAGAQTGVYPLDTPGGWHILGHTHLLMFDPTRDPPALFRAGDSVQFVRVQ
jgi:KipI family sensor histidine kinase inhibitor